MRMTEWGLTTMFELFRTLVLALTLVAPGQVGCNAPIHKATLCWVRFENPSAVEYIKPSQIARLRALIQIKELERN